MDEQGNNQDSPPSDKPHSEDEDYQAASRSTADYANYEQPEKPKNPIWRKLGIALAILAALIIIGGAATFFLKHHKSSPKSPANSSQSQPSQTASSQAAGSITAQTKHYSSSNFQLDFDYPKDWTVTDNGGGVMTAKSPAIALKSSDGQSVNAQIVLSFRANDQKLPEFDAGNAQAVFDSVKIAYAKPTQTQRGSTYESFLRYANSPSGLDGIYITGDSGYTKGQAIPKVDIQKVNPIISIQFYKCADSTCISAAKNISIQASAWDDKSFSKPLESMLESLSIN